jgi:hypothetical protein
MDGTHKKTIEIFEKTGLSRVEFCKRVSIPPSYLSALQNEKTWNKIPAWVWYFFQCISNRLIAFDSDGKIVHVTDGYSVDELQEDCKRKAEERLQALRKPTGEGDKLTKTGLVIPLLDDSDDPTVDDIRIGNYQKGMGPMPLETLVIHVMDEVIDTGIKNHQNSITSLKQLKKNLAKWKKKGK